MTDESAAVRADSVTPASIARLHDITTLFHAFIYFAPEAVEEYGAVGLEGRSGYFASRTAAMGPLPTEMVIATFYNFSPDLVVPAMDGVWERLDAPTVQSARWRAVRRVLDAHVRPVLDDVAIDEALAIAEEAMADLTWSGRPMAAGNAAALAHVAADDALVRLWQVITVLREWRGDTHIALLVAEPLDGAECTVVSELMGKVPAGAVKTSRAWSDADWADAIARLEGRGWIGADGAITDNGRAARSMIEQRTNELSVPMWAATGVSRAERLGELLRPGTEALRDAGYFKAIGLRPRTA